VNKYPFPQGLTIVKSFNYTKESFTIKHTSFKPQILRQNLKTGSTLKHTRKKIENDNIIISFSPYEAILSFTPCRVLLYPSNTISSNVITSDPI